MRTTSLVLLGSVLALTALACGETTVGDDDGGGGGAGGSGGAEGEAYLSCGRAAQPLPCALGTEGVCTTPEGAEGRCIGEGRCCTWGFLGEDDP